MVIDKNFLKNNKKLTLVFENCDVYDLSVEYILDFHFEVELKSETKNKLEYLVNSGFIKISKSAERIIELGTIRNNLQNTEYDARLKQRLQLLDGCADIVSIELVGDKNNARFYIPYDPLIEVIRGGEIEYTNCPSFELDNNGDMVIYFGALSKLPTRKDNNYNELIVGWAEYFNDYKPENLKVNAHFLNVCSGEKVNVFLSFEILDKLAPKKLAELVFVNCKNINIEACFPLDGEVEIVASKTLDGNIYVGLDGLNIDFTCSQIVEYNYFCNHNH